MLLLLIGRSLTQERRGLEVIQNQSLSISAAVDARPSRQCQENAKTVWNGLQRLGRNKDRRADLRLSLSSFLLAFNAVSGNVRSFADA